MRILTLFLAVGSLALVGSGCKQLKSRDQINQGVTAFKGAQYPEAVEHFKQAVDLDPGFVTARLYLATAYMQQYIPGAESPENTQMAKAAMDQFNTVLETDPKNSVAIASIASLYLNGTKRSNGTKSWPPSIPKTRMPTIAWALLPGRNGIPRWGPSEPNWA
jgi:Tfp pilus assembly protein PilF